MNTNALTNARKEDPCQCDETIAKMQCLIEELADRLDQVEMQLALTPARPPLSIWQYLKWRFAA